MATLLKVSTQQRKMAGSAMHAGNKAMRHGAGFCQYEQNYQDARDRRDGLAEIREGGNVVLTLLAVLLIAGLAVGSYYVGKTLWGELLITFDSLGQRSYLVAGVMSVVITLTFVLANIFIHASDQRSFNEAGFSPNTNVRELLLIIFFAGLRLGLGVTAWWVLQVSLSAITPNYQLTYNELTYVFADLLLIVGEWIVSRWMGRHGITNLQFGIAGLQTRWAERGMNRSAERTYEHFFEQRRYLTLHNETGGFTPLLEEQGSPKVQRAIRYHMGMNPVQAEEPNVEPPMAPTEAPAPAAVNLDDELDEVVEQVQADEEEHSMTLDDYINEQAQNRTNNLFD